MHTYVHLYISMDMDPVKFYSKRWQTRMFCWWATLNGIRIMDNSPSIELSSNFYHLLSSSIFFCLLSIYRFKSPTETCKSIDICLSGWLSSMSTSFQSFQVSTSLSKSFQVFPILNHLQKWSMFEEYTHKSI